MGREVKRVAEGSAWGEHLPEDTPFIPGDWFQMWQTVSDKPYTPAFKTAEELATWCANHPWGMEKDDPIPFSSWLKFINGPGWAPSMVMSGNGVIVSGIDFSIKD